MIVEAGTTGVVERLADAINRHDVDALLKCFDPNVNSEQPTRPGRGFRGRDAMRGYWEQVLGGPGYFEAHLLRHTTDGDTVWAEWCWQGTRVDGTQFARAGVTIYGVRDGLITWIRLYMEPMQGDPDTVGEWIMREIGRNDRR